MRGVLHVNIIEPVSEKMHNQREVTDTILSYRQEGRYDSRMQDADADNVVLCE